MLEGVNMGHDIMMIGSYPDCFTPKNSTSLPSRPLIPWKFETLSFLLFIFIIHSHFQGE